METIVSCQKKSFLSVFVSQARMIHSDIPEQDLGPSRVAMESWPAGRMGARVIHAATLLLMGPAFVRHLPGSSCQYVAAAVFPRGNGGDSLALRSSIEFVASRDPAECDFDDGTLRIGQDGLATPGGNDFFGADRLQGVDTVPVKS